MALRLDQIVRIERSKHGIFLDAPVEPIHERSEERLTANSLIDV